jgi:hypothetical protein
MDTPISTDCRAVRGACGAVEEGACEGGRGGRRGVHSCGTSGGIGHPTLRRLEDLP